MSYESMVKEGVPAKTAARIFCQKGCHQYSWSRAQWIETGGEGPKTVKYMGKVRRLISNVAPSLECLKGRGPDAPNG